MSPAPRPAAPVWAAPHPSDPILGILGRATPSDQRPALSLAHGGRADSEAVLCRAALRTAQIRRFRGTPPFPGGPTPDATAHDAVARIGWDKEGGSPNGRTADVRDQGILPLDRDAVRIRPRQSAR